MFTIVHNSAGFWIRFGANLLDGVLFMLIGFINALYLSSAITGEITNLMQFLYYLLIPLFWYGYTLGKKICKVRIVRMDGNNVTFWTMIKRYLIAGLLYTFPLLVCFLIIFSMIGSDAWQLLTVSPEQESELNPVFYEQSTSTLLIIGSLLTFSLFMVSAFMVGLSKSRRSIHDLIAGTYVTYDTPEETKQVYTNET